MNANLEPEGWPISLNNVRPGLILVINGKSPEEHFIAFKSEYMHDDNIRPMAYNEAGEYLCIDNERLVQAVRVVWREEE